MQFIVFDVFLLFFVLSTKVRNFWLVSSTHDPSVIASCPEVICWPTSIFCLCAHLQLFELICIRRCFGWRHTWQLFQGARSHGALKSAASLAVLRLPASHGSTSLNPLISRWQKHKIAHLESSIVIVVSYIDMVFPSHTD